MRQTDRTGSTTTTAIPFVWSETHDSSIVDLVEAGGATGPDPSFPHPGGSIGVWGYDFRDGGSLVLPSRLDVMSYCAPRWISDYHFTNALSFRLSEAEPDPGPQTRSLLLWGGVEADGVSFLEPAFVVEAPPTLPQSGGEYRLTGRTGGGAQLFSLSFAMPEVADGDGSASFAFTLPVRSEWEHRLELRDVQDLDMERADVSAALGAGPGLEVLFSRGIPDAAAWRR